MKLIMLVALLFAPVIAHAGYKCTKDGRTFYSESPWCEDSRGVVGSIPQSSENAGIPEAEMESGRALCGSRATDNIVWKDRESVRIEGIYGGDFAIITHAGRKTVTRKYVVMVNAKNSFGAYGGASPIFCYTSQDGGTIISVNRSKFR